MKVAVVTGATSGIGKKTVELLLSKDISVIGLSRTIEKAERVKKEMEPFLKHASLDFVIGDLSDLRKTECAAHLINNLIDQKYQGVFDLLFHVAGIVSSKYIENEDQNELTFAVNHLSVFYLSYFLISRLEKSDDPRMLVVSSKSHYRANINWKNIQSKRCYNILKAYKRSKTYNVLFVKGFQKRFPHIYSFAIDPGLVNTELGLKNTGPLASFVWNHRRKKGTDVKIPTTYMIDVATKKYYQEFSGLYIKDGSVVKSNIITYDQKHIDQMWAYSEGLTKIKFDDHHKFDSSNT